MLNEHPFPKVRWAVAARARLCVHITIGKKHDLAAVSAQSKNLPLIAGYMSKSAHNATPHIAGFGAVFDRTERRCVRSVTGPPRDRPAWTIPRTRPNRPVTGIVKFRQPHATNLPSRIASASWHIRTGSATSEMLCTGQRGMIDSSKTTRPRSPGDQSRARQ